MTKYRIKKGSRELKATRLASIEELLRRGLLKADDVVSVDGAEFIPLRALDELRPFFEESSSSDAADEDVGTESLSDGMKTPVDDPWRHWTKEENAQEDEGADDVLSSFLGEVKATESGTFPAIRRSNPRIPAIPRLSQPRMQAIRGEELEEIVEEPDREQAGSASTSEPIGPVVVAGADLESISQGLPSEADRETSTTQAPEWRPTKVGPVPPSGASIPPKRCRTRPGNDGESRPSPHLPRLVREERGRLPGGDSSRALWSVRRWHL